MSCLKSSETPLESNSSSVVCLKNSFANVTEKDALANTPNIKGFSASQVPRCIPLIPGSFSNVKIDSSVERFCKLYNPLMYCPVPASKPPIFELPAPLKPESERLA